MFCLCARVDVRADPMEEFKRQTESRTRRAAEPQYDSSKKKKILLNATDDGFPHLFVLSEGLLFCYCSRPRWDGAQQHVVSQGRGHVVPACPLQLPPTLVPAAPRQHIHLVQCIKHVAW